MRSLGDADVLVSLVKVLRTAERKRAARREWQVAGEQQVDSVDLDRNAAPGRDAGNNSGRS